MSPYLKTTLKIVFIIAALSILTYAGVLLRKQYTPSTTSQTSDATPLNPTETTPNTTNPDVSNTPDTSTPPSQQPQTSSDAPPTVPKPPKPNSNTSPFIPQTLPSTDKNAHIYIPLSKVSCEKNCSQFTKDTELQYCQEYCGLESWNTTDNCSDLKNLKQDYCFKAQAIDKTDPTLCKKITDDNIRVACKNRVLEDIVDQQKSQ